MRYSKNEFVNTCMENLRSSLRNEMNCKDYTLTRMASECNIDYSTLCNILYSKTQDVTLSTLSRIADGLGKSAESLLTYSKETENGGASYE